MPADVLAGRVIPTPVEQLEHSADFIIPAYGKIGTGQIGEIHKIKLFLIRKSTPAEAVVNVTHQSQRDVVLEVHFNTFVLSGAMHDTADTALPVYGNGGIFGMKVDFTVAAHIIILTGSPRQAYTGCKAVITVAELFQNRRVESRIDG